ncbi:hypothetical protein DFH06DRAFT_373060 [Mycena polygramma]|nr:hypothetical protein DFH06DRAFT_373060 [Mycena polygramma]
MAKTATTTKTKTATKDANTKTKAKKADDGGEKTKRAPSAYNIYVSENLKKWNEANPDKKKQGMAAVAAMWKDAPENPNRGKTVEKRAPKAKKEKEPKADAKKPSKSKAKPKKKDDEDEEDDAEDEKENEIQSSDD